MQDKRDWHAELLAQLDDEQKQVSVTDPDTRRMPTAQGNVVGYNAQLAVDAQHKLIAADDVTNEVNDLRQLASVALTAKENLGFKQTEVVTDKGYYSAAEVSRCVEQGITPYIPKTDTSANTKQGLYGKRKFSFLVGVAILLVTSQSYAENQFRAEHIDWARLLTPNIDWRIHGDRDATLALFIRANTSLDIQLSPYPADPAHLDQLCCHPFIYAKDLRWVTNEAQLANIGEYLRRGGFMCVDACATEAVNPDMEAYLRDNRAIFKRMFPEAEIRKLPETHGIYTCYFKLSRADLYTVNMGNQEKCANYGLYGVFVDDRMVAVINMYGLQCGWPQTPMRAPGCMKFILNTYVYAMTAGPERDK